ncbi:restriction endonuclease subunit S [Streptococcus oralis subsp. tigurinus]|uniref:Restriction endonuclease subunit S n=1 Tax=Streptococcus oralis subsp. tigurinus TaxID=1077464 RepID=A0A1X1FVP5_STROR|nr:MULTISPECIES: restriction endonuclease subunit S [Streptococcus]MCY7091781.1 restriction endonuclease subunit S [Streptococcus oralis]ORO38420.1 restriction endonuclease subunit S [Streptococcus oralis subsp. tigurinus]ORO46302.1 restriction endonuclease subunit S [Streptococcus oralis subsp. tigurinus]
MSEVTWEITSLSELGTFSRGKSKHRPRNDIKLFEGGTYPLVQTGDVKAANLYITKNNSYYNDFGLKQSKLWPAGTLCITIAANIAETAILSYPMCFPDSIVGFNANPEKSSELFVYYFFEYIKKEIQKSASGSIQDNINIDYLSKMRIKVPEKEYQDKIVDLLSSIDKKILLNNQINQELEDMAKTLYDYWFVQFDFPDQNGKPYKSSGGKMVYNPELKREIPEGWGVESVGNLLDKVTKAEKIENNSIEFIGEIPVIDQSQKYIAGFTNNENAILQPQDGHVIFGDHTRVVKYINFDYARGADGTQVLISNNENISNVLLYHMIEDFDLSNYGYARHFKFLKEKTVIVPDKEVSSKFETQANVIYEKIKNNIFEDQELTQLRDWLLPMLMNGQVKVE